MPAHPVHVTVIGGGPAGSAAALSAMRAGARVELVETSRFPRHKVCGEFISPEMLPVLERLGVANRFLQAQPARIRRLRLQFGLREKTAVLPECAFGLSRYVFDQLLFDCACQASTKPGASVATVIAHGRKGRAPRGGRLFGFKSHFRGPSSDTIELHFFDHGYIGISAIENGLTNVCGLASEPALARIDFEYDELIRSVPSLAERIRPLERVMDWLTTGPLVLGHRLDMTPPAGVYYAGDALSFVDPFTGSGMYCAVLTGMIAGASAARGVPPAQCVSQCREALGRSFAFSSVFRNAITGGWAQHVAPLIPAGWLYRLTRPRCPTGYF